MKTKKNLGIHAYKLHVAAIVDTFNRYEIHGRLVLEATIQSPRYLTIFIRLTDPTHRSKALKAVDDVALAAENDGGILPVAMAGYIGYQCALPKKLWQNVYRNQLESPYALGIGQGGREVVYDDSEPHALFIGATGSGKTTGMRHFILEETKVYSPDQYRMVILDEAGELSRFSNSAHLEMAIAERYEERISAIQHVHNEFILRRDRKIKDGPILAVYMDEPETGNEDDEERVQNQLAEIAVKGRKYNIFLRVGIQEPLKSKLPYVGQCNNRMIGRVGSSRDSANFSGHPDIGAEKLTGQGDFLYLRDEEPQRFQFPLLKDSDYDGIERAEPKPIEIVEALAEPEEPTYTDKRRMQIEIDKLAYMMINPGGPFRQAKADAGLTQKQHQRYRDDWCPKLRCAMRKYAIQRYQRKSFTVDQLCKELLKC